MSQHPVDYRAPELKPRPVVRSVILIVLGLLLVPYGLIGAAFVEGAVERGDSSVSRAGVLFLLLLAAGGIAMITFGILGLRRRAAT
jgi:uncharacterized membrane protein